MSNNTENPRRRFLKQTAATLAMPYIIPAHVLGLRGQTTPSNKIVMGVVGWGMQGPGNTQSFMREQDCQVVAACDLDTQHLDQAVAAVNKKYGNTDCKAYGDFRELFARKDIDAVMLAVPDTWHGILSVEAAKSGKDIYGEKPLARTIREQQAIVKAVQDNKRIWQTGSWQRSVEDFWKACEIVRNGLIGKIKHVEVGLPAGHTDFAGTKDKMQVSEPPAHLNYDMWIGPSQMEPYIEGRVHKNWRWNYNIGGGQLLDWIGHHCDIAHWGLDYDNNGPVEISGHGVFPAKDAVWNTATRYCVQTKYASGVTMTIAGGYDQIRSGTKWIGEDGWVWVDRGGFDSSDPAFRRFSRLPEDLRKVALLRSPGHWRNFLDCVKSRQPTITPVEAAHHSALPGHLGLISMLVNRKLKWDPVKEEILGDDEATKLMGREFRAPWKIVA